MDMGGPEGGRGSFRVRTATVAFALAIAWLALMPAAPRADPAPTRAEWVAQADPICLGALRQEQALEASILPKAKNLERKSLRAKSKKARHRVGRTFKRLVAAYFRSIVATELGVNSQVATIPPAPPDESLVAVWLRARGEYLVAVEQFFRAVLRGKEKRAFKRVFRAAVLAQEVDDIGRDFKFLYCNLSSGSGTLFSASRLARYS